MKILITGGAGFIGSNLVKRLIRDDYEVVVFDNLSNGNEKFLEEFKDNSRFSFIKGSLLDRNQINDSMIDVDAVFHLAANSDVKGGATNMDIDLEQNVICTNNVLFAMRKNNVKKLVFSSTSAVYGEVKKFPIREDYSPKEPISLYGASKLSAESFICAYSKSFGLQSIIFRFANVVGHNSTHGVIHDFIRKLKSNQDELEILGNGEQNKSYIYVDDCVDGMLFVMEHTKSDFKIYNLGTEDQMKVKDIAGLVSDRMGLDPKFAFTGGDRGWVGDVPTFKLDITKIKSLGWDYRYNSREAVERTVEFLLK